VAINETPPNEFYNLPLVLAYAALEDFLNECLVESLFTMRKPTSRLGDKMRAAKTTIPWVDFATVDTGRDARNHLAHRGVICAKPDCLRYIDAVGAELKNWHMI